MTADSGLLELGESIGKALGESVSKGLGNSLAGFSHGAALQSAAIVCALAECGLVDPLKVAAWADCLAACHSQNEGATPETRKATAESLERFSELIRLLATRPEGGLGLSQ